MHWTSSLRIHSPSEARVATYANKGTCPVGQRASRLIEQRDCDVPDAVACAHDRDPGRVVHLDFGELREIDDQVAVRATEAVASVGVAA